MQLSVVGHKNLYSNIIKNKEGLIKVPTEITTQERLKFEMMIKSGNIDGTRPYTSPVYLTYTESIKSIYNQGILAFYKGNGWGTCHFITMNISRFIPLAVFVYFDNYMQKKYQNQCSCSCFIGGYV